MPKRTPIINDFRAGELTPITDARADLKDYYRGCRVLENAMPIIEGGVIRVPGTYYVRPTKLTEEGWNIRITKSGWGTGVVTSDFIPGIDCGSDCYDFFIEGSTVVLTGSPDAGSTFTEWSGEGFDGADPISVLMDGNKIINAEFSIPASTAQQPLCMAKDATYLYIGGPVTLQKRRLSDLALIKSTVVSTVVLGVGVDGSGVYICGSSGSGPSILDVQKYNLSLSELLWSYTYQEGTTENVAFHLSVDGDGVYVAGYKRPTDRVYKAMLNLTTGAEIFRATDTLIHGYGCYLGGDGFFYITQGASGALRGIEKVKIADWSTAQTSYPSPGGNLYKGVVSGGNLYVTGLWPSSGSAIQIVIHKILVTDLSIIWTQQLNYAAGAWQTGTGIICDGDFIYILMQIAATLYPRIEKRDLDGNLIWGVNLVPNTDAIYRYCSCIEENGNYLYVGISNPAGSMGRIEKRNKSDGSLDDSVIW